MEHFFSPNSIEHLRSDAHQSQIIGGDADVDHTQTIGGDTVKLLGDLPRVSAPQALVIIFKTIENRLHNFCIYKISVSAKTISKICIDQKQSY